ncbi:MAG: CdaR family protein [Myxococcota bacterium]|nr:CdaR family protein [Myxococcota bacterium]
MSRDRKGLRRFIRDLFLENLGWKLLTGALAVLAWTWIQGERVLPASAWAQVEYQLPEGLVLTQTPAKRVRVTVNGPQNLTRALERRDLSLSVDLSELGPGKQSVDFVDTPIQGLPEGIAVMALKPNSLQVELEPEASRPVRLEPVVVGSPAKGFRLAEVVLDPPSVEIVGPESAVEKLDRVVTRALVLDGLTAGATRKVSLDLPDPLRMAYPGPVSAELRIEALNSTRTFTDVPVVCRDPGWESQTKRVSVVLEGPVADLQALELDALTVMVVLPSEQPWETLEVGLNSSGARLEVVHPGGEDLVVTALEPPKINVEPLSQ